MSTRPVEVELKYRLSDAGTGERLLSADDVAGFSPTGPARTTQNEDRYLDTADGALARSGFAARLRSTPGGTVVTVKGLNGHGGNGSDAHAPGAVQSTGRVSILMDDGPPEPPAHGRAFNRREELEGPADRASQPRDWPSSDARALILELCGDAPLVELVTVRQLRRKRELRRGNTVVELSLDDVDVVARGRVVDRFAELEVELLDGDESDLGDLETALGNEPQLEATTGSKLETALAAARSDRGKGGGRGKRDKDGGKAAASNGAVLRREGHRQVAGRDTAERADEERLIVGKTPGVVAEDTIAEAGRKVLRFHFARMLAKESGTRSGEDPEDLHGMRVATRRMRAGWRLFGDGFRQGRTKRYRSMLRDVAGRLGAVRDLDVLIDALEAYRAELPAAERDGLGPLVAAWRAQRDDARILLLRELDSDGYGTFVDDFRDFVRTEGAGVQAVVPTEPHRVRDSGASRVWAAFEQVRAYEPVLRWADVETLHELRIAAKRLRYALEFIREALGTEAGLLITRVVALQDHLGNLNDATVASSMARAFLVERAGRLTESESAAIGRYLVDRERAVARLRRTVGPTWRGVAGLTFRRRLGRTLAAM